MEVKVISPAEEKDLLDEWFATVEFIPASEGIPELEPEDDDEEPESRDLSTVDMDELMEELRARDPKNPF